MGEEYHAFIHITTRKLTFEVVLLNIENIKIIDIWRSDRRTFYLSWQ